MSINFRTAKTFNDHAGEFIDVKISVERESTINEATLRKGRKRGLRLKSVERND